MCDVNRLYIYAASPSAPVFQCVKHLIRYILGYPNYTVIYPSFHDSTTTHELRQDVSSVDFHYQKISNGIVAFEESVEGWTDSNKRAIPYIILCLFCVSVHFSAKRHPFNILQVLHLLLGNQMVQWLRLILQKLGFQVSNAPTPIYENSQYTINIIKGKTPNNKG